jgi:DNA-binding beta-propeller fold protein YncE
LLLFAVHSAACGSSDEQADQPAPAGDAGAAGSAGAAGAAGEAGAAGSAGMQPHFASEEELDPFTRVPPSCAYKCPSSTCAETTTPYACPSLADWNALPHAESCGAWDGVMPTPTPGQCTVSDPTGEAAKYAGPDPDDPSTIVMPDGRRLRPAGADWVFAEPELYAGMTSTLARVPGTSLVLTVDNGYGDHVVRLVETAKIDGKQNPTLGYVKFGNPFTLNQSIAFASPGRAYVATAQGSVQALKIDATLGTIEKDDASNIALPMTDLGAGKAAPYYVASIALSQSGERMFVTGVDDPRLLIVDSAPASPTYGQVLGQVELGAAETFGVYADPHDPESKFVYVTMWQSGAVREIDVSNPASPQQTLSYTVERNPQGLVFLDARWMLVGNALGDSFSIIDRTSKMVTTVPVDEASKLHGPEPTTLAYDEPRKRVYATLAGLNAVAGYDVDLTSEPPTLMAVGKLQAQWWPSGVVTMDDGALIVTSLEARGHGPITDNANDDQYTLLHGGIQRVPAPSAGVLIDGEAQVKKGTQVGELAGRPVVTCPEGVMDFPLPSTNDKPSPRIEHVIVVVKENKTFEGLFGDFPGVNGSPDHLNRPVAEMDKLWKNIRKLSRTFAISDNYYTDAMLSNQGHVWTTHGRSNDFNEREWAVTGYGRDTRPVGDSGGVPKVSKPEEGSVFEWMARSDIPFDIFGEIVGLPSTSTKRVSQDGKYPGGIIQNIGWPDTEKACYIGNRAKVLCDLGRFTYMTLPNDHGQGLSASKPAPDTMIAVNDEAAGLLVDLISHSAIWPKTLIIITEDDPAQGVDYVDYHRTVFTLASPWVRRGYVSHTHVDVSSIYKMVSHILGVPYPDVQIADAGLPLDIFSSTPDYTPFTYEPREWPLQCGDKASQAEQQLTASWDFGEEDRQPGLGAQAQRWLNGKQLTSLPPAILEDMERRAARKATLERVRHDDDD